MARMYAGEADRQAMVRLVAQTTDRERAQVFHVGDVLWGLYQNTVFDPSAGIRLWEDERGALVGFAWIDNHGNLALYVDPRLVGTLEPEMLDWAERQTHKQAQTAGGAAKLDVQVRESDGTFLALLEGHGYRREDCAFVYLRQELDQPIPAPELPIGWSVRSVGDEEDWQDRVSLHREVWHPSRVTLDAYRRLQGVEGYAHELDLVVVSPEGEFGSYCIVWYDSVTQIGEFEPVGTRVAYRRMGLGKAVLREGLRRLRSRGARTAIVYTTDTNEPAVKLYESAGFRIRDRFLQYSRVVTCSPG
jgi:ribosomal protein S18 acetylase RimI-like enzyme